MNFTKALFGGISLLAVLIFFRDLSGFPITGSLCVEQVLASVAFILCLYTKRDDRS